MAKTFQLNASQFLPISREEAWKFFSSPKNLALITPPDMKFKILSEPGQETHEGMLIDYSVRPLLGIPLFWRTEISKLQKPDYFIDSQLKGPYKLWEHTHRFKDVEGGVMMEDQVRYQLPFGFLGLFAHRLFVKKRLAQIFDFRKQVLLKIFNRHE